MGHGSATNKSRQRVERVNLIFSYHSRKDWFINNSFNLHRNGNVCIGFRATKGAQPDIHILFKYDRKALLINTLEDLSFCSFEFEKLFDLILLRAVLIYNKSFEADRLQQKGGEKSVFNQLENEALGSFIFRCYFWFSAFFSIFLRQTKNLYNLRHFY